MKGRTYRYLRQAPLYPFGYGLTYGRVVTEEAKLLSDFSVQVKVRNEGERDTAEVLEVYVEPLESKDAPDHPRLCGFKRIFVPAGQELVAEVALDEDTYTVVNDEGERIPGGRSYRLYVGTGQPDERTEELTGRKALCLEMARD